MRERAKTLVKRTPRTVLAFAALCLLLDAAELIIYRRRIGAHAAVWAVEFVVAFALLAALVVWRRRWAWWLCVIEAVAWLVSPAWGVRFHPLTDLIDAVFLALLLTPSMRRHVGGVFGWRRPGSNSRWWSLKAWLVSLGIGAVFTALAFVGGRSATLGRDIGHVLFGLIVAVAIRLVGFLLTLAVRLIRRRDSPAT